MEKLDQKYKVELDSIGGAIQSSNLLSTYLDDEEEDSYQALREEFEPQIEAVYVKVASENPLQLISFEQDLLDPSFEGLYLSKILNARDDMSYDENYGAFLLVMAPLNIVVLPFAPFALFMKPSPRMNNFLMVMHNHGSLAVGRTAAEAFFYLYYLEMSCKIQVDILASGEQYIEPDAEAVASLKDYGMPGDTPKGEREWPTLMRMLDRIDPSFRE